MSNELVEQKTGELVSAINQQGIGELLKPLIREIHLFDCEARRKSEIPAESGHNERTA